MKKNNSTVIIAVLVIVLLAFLTIWPRVSDPHKLDKKRWSEAGIACLSAHTNASQHIHPKLTITANGSNEIIPADLGNVTGCMAEIHTHDATGTIHVESAHPKKQFTLQHFFAVWGKPIIREGYTLKATVNGREAQSPENVVLEDDQQIVLEYTKS